jgi:hypothetical protein
MNSKCGTEYFGHSPRKCSQNVCSKYFGQLFRAHPQNELKIWYMLAQLPNMQKPGATRQTWQKHVGQTCPNMLAKLVQTCWLNMTKHVNQT